MKTVNDIFCVKQAVYKRVSIWQVYRQFCQDFTTSFVASINSCFLSAKLFILRLF